MIDSRRISLLACLLAALTFAACGGDDDDDGGGGGGSDEAEIREVVNQLANNDPKACDNITDSFYQQTGTSKEECEKSSNEPDEGPKPEVESVSVEGKTATAIVIDEDRTEIALVDEGGQWKIDEVVSSEPVGEGK